MYNFKYFSLQGLGTDEDTLVEILASRTNKEIREIKQAYKQGNINANECPIRILQGQRPAEFSPSMP